MSRVKEKINKQIRKTRQRSYLARDFDSFRAELYDYAKTYFGDKIQDFSEASVGGLLLDMAAMVGDTMSFYLDHQFNELNWETAVETDNIQRHLSAAGITAYGASPAVVTVTFTVTVPANNATGEAFPDIRLLPTIGAGTVVSGGSVNFSTVDDLVFSEVDRTGLLVAKVSVKDTDDNGNPTSFLVAKDVVAISGKEVTQVVSIPATHKPFRKVNLNRAHVSEIMEVKDADGNEYFQVESLSQDTVFRGIINVDENDNLVEQNLEVVPAPYRYRVLGNVRSRTTTIQFGGGDAESLDDDIIPDPSDMSLPLYGKNVFSRFSIDPASMLETQTLGIAPKNTTITIKFRCGGGISHNVVSNVVKNISTLHVTWPECDFDDPTLLSLMRTTKSGIRVNNEFPAGGGMAEPDIEDLRAQIPALRSLQSRIVSKEDLLARIYTLPAKFGRVFRAGIRKNPNNPLAAELSIICLDNQKKLTVAPDALKKNLRIYLNEFRLISDAIDILDARVINFKVDFDIVVDPKFNKTTVVQTIIAKIANLLELKNFQIDQPIIMVDIMNAIINTNGLLTMTAVRIQTVRGVHDDRVYSNISFNMDAHTVKGLIIGPPGSIFELRYPKYDITGNAS